jgi:phosphomevalonate kinase
MAHDKAQGNGSGIDLAASTYKGVLLFESLDREWILNHLNQGMTIAELVELKWPCGRVKALSLPDNLRIAIAWTGEKASTKDFAQAYMEIKEENQLGLDAFKKTTDLAIELFLQACRDNSVDMILEAIREQGSNLAYLEKLLCLPIETPKLRLLCKTFARIGVAKLSGAGGGDCGIGFYDKNNEEDLKGLIEQWRKDEIIALITD